MVNDLSFMRDAVRPVCYDAYYILELFESTDQHRDEILIEFRCMYRLNSGRF